MNMINSTKLIIVLLFINIINCISNCDSGECNIDDEKGIIRQWIYEHYEDPILLSIPVNGVPLNIKFAPLDQVILLYNQSNINTNNMNIIGNRTLFYS